MGIVPCPCKILPSSRYIDLELAMSDGDDEFYQLCGKCMKLFRVLYQAEKKREAAEITDSKKS
jgi:hypothetical protein